MTLPSSECSWKEWFLPLKFDSYSLQEVLDSSGHIKAEQDDIPLMIRLIENPAYDLPGFDIFHGAVNLHDHDCIHAMLGRGLMSKDEAFVIGFTMGSTNKVSTTEQKLYSWAAKYLYPGPYKFNDEDIHVFKDAVHLGYVSDCQALDQVDYDTLKHQSLKSIRAHLGIEVDLLLAYFGIESRRYPNSVESQRLL